MMPADGWHSTASSLPCGVLTASCVLGKPYACSPWVTLILAQGGNRGREGKKLTTDRGDSEQRPLPLGPRCVFLLQRGLSSGLRRGWAPGRHLHSPAGLVGGLWTFPHPGPGFGACFLPLPLISTHCLLCEGKVTRFAQPII